MISFNENKKLRYQINIIEHEAKIDVMDLKIDYLVFNLNNHKSGEAMLSPHALNNMYSVYISLLSRITNFEDMIADWGILINALEDGDA